MTLHETELNRILTRTELERMQAVEHLFSVVLAENPADAIDDARVWLKHQYGAEYAQMGRCLQLVSKAMRQCRQRGMFL